MGLVTVVVRSRLTHRNRLNPNDHPKARVNPTGFLSQARTLLGAGKKDGIRVGDKYSWDREGHARLNRSTGIGGLEHTVSCPRTRQIHGCRAPDAF